jgi:methyl-accepting chemotaxis protein
MKWFYDLKISKKLLLGFGLVAAITAAVGGMGIYNMGTINEMADTMYMKELLGVSYIKEANINLMYSERALKNAILANTLADRAQRLENVQKFDKAFLDNVEKAEPCFYTDKGKKLMADLKKAYDEYTPVEKQILETIAREGLAENRESARLSNGIGREKIDVVDNLMTELSRAKEELAKQYSEETTRIYESSRLFMIALVVGSVFLGISIGVFISRIISKAIQKALDFSQKIARGDFSEKIDIDQKDELGLLAAALNESGGKLNAIISRIQEFAGKLADGDFTDRVKMDAMGEIGMLGILGEALNKSADNLEKLVSEIIVASQNLSQAVQEIARGNENLSQRTSEQASALEEIASTIEETTASSRQNAENAMEANRAAEESSRMGGEGIKVTAETITSINDINLSSKKIGEIISVINEIAFQTNLLALNAAVEAARAGEQGRGFAVVAGEVRNLAQRAGSSAKEIGNLIKDSLDKIDGGTTLVQKSSEALNEIVNSSKKVGRLISEIASASEEQKRGIDQVNIAVTELDNMTQQNAALVEETASASEEMSNQAGELMNMMLRFRINEKIRDGIYSAKHKEMHLNAAGRNTTAKTGKGNGDGKGRPVQANVESKPDIASILAEDGFERF